MKINRRDLLFASGLSLLAGTRVSGQGAAPPRAQSQTPRSPSARLLEALQGNRLPLTKSCQFHNEAEQGAESTLTTILGRTAAYMGREVTWDKMIRSNENWNLKLNLDSLG